MLRKASVGLKLQESSGGRLWSSCARALSELAPRRSITRADMPRSDKSVQTHMRRANLGNMFAPLLASSRINQLNAQTRSLITDAKIGKVFHELSVSRVDLDFMGKVTASSI